MRHEKPKLKTKDEQNVANVDLLKIKIGESEINKNNK